MADYRYIMLPGIIGYLLQIKIGIRSREVEKVQGISPPVFPSCIPPLDQQTFDAGAIIKVDVFFGVFCGGLGDPP